MFKTIHHVLHRHYHAKYHGVYRHAKKLFVFDLGLLALSFVFLIAGLFFFFWKPNLEQMIDLSLSIGNSRVKSGDKVELSIRYTNHSKERLENTTLALKLPPGFVPEFKDLPETFQKNSTFQISSLEPGASGQIKVSGRLWGELNQPEKILGVLSYHPASKPTETEQKLTPLIINLPESILKTSLVVATTTFPNQKLPFIYTITNTGSVDVEGLNIEANSTGKVALTTPSTSLLLNAGETKTLNGTVTTLSSSSTSLNLLAQVQIGNLSLKQSTINQPIIVLLPKITSSLKTTKSTEYIEAGQTLPVNLVLKNDSNLNLKNIRITLVNKLGLINLTATAKENNLKIENNSLVLDKTNRTFLVSSKPGSAENTAPLNLILIPTFGQKIAEDAKTFILESLITSEVDGVSGQTYSQTGDTLSLPLATELSLSSQVRYYTPEGDQLGRGPIPPKVGEATKYWVFARMFNTINSVNNIHFEANLAPNTTFTGKQSVTIGPSLRQVGNKVIWDYAELPAFSETGLFFEVSALPGSSDVGKSLSLIQSIVVTATDPSVNKALSAKQGLLDNKLRSNDEGSKLGNKVRP